MKNIVFEQSKTKLPDRQVMKIVDAAARLVPLLKPNSEFQGARLTFDFAVVGGQLQIQNVILEKTPPTKLVIQ